MIDILTFIDELRSIQMSLNTIESKKRVSGIIDQTVEKYENMVEEFEKDQENQQKLMLDN
mgnify:FL=1|jgi:hypothetical protein|tara:strand:+ start:117 stop:296 length:180 start_codon:yes stop_codon:yes gene_type:complete